MEHIYIAIDLKSFYASVECVTRGLNPLTTNLVVADIERTEKTICLAVSPSLKSYGIPGRPRLFEVIQQVKTVNAERKKKAKNHKLTGESTDNTMLTSFPELAVDYIVATPRMGTYIDFSKHVYEIYLKYIAPEDIHVYSIDEVFIDATPYLQTYKLSPRELAMKMIYDVLIETGITATVGIGTNLYLCKIAMDIVAKKMPPDKDGVRIAELDELSYRQQLWEHTPLTDFWRIGNGYEKKLKENYLYTMGDIARCSIENEELLYKLFGINAELLIDHAWGVEPCTMSEIKAYKPSTNSISTGQVLSAPYCFEKTEIIIREMTDLLVLDLVDKGVVTDQMILTIGYDTECLKNSEGTEKYSGEITTDRYGRSIPKQAHGSINLGEHTSSTSKIIDAVIDLFNRITDKNLLVRRISVAANHVITISEAQKATASKQYDLFTDFDSLELNTEEEKKASEREKRRQKAVIALQKKYGKNTIVKGISLQEGATTIERNRQIGGHKA